MLKNIKKFARENWLVLAFALITITLLLIINQRISLAIKNSKRAYDYASDAVYYSNQALNNCEDAASYCQDAQSDCQNCGYY
jgi:hypothetical protein